jgi:hypothetical protein
MKGFLSGALAAVNGPKPMSWQWLRLPRLRGLGAALALRPF